MSLVRILWSKGGEAVVVALKDDAVTLRSTVPSPPGSRIEGVLAGVASVGDPVRVKVYSSKRQEDGQFVIDGRMLDMTRTLRDKISPAPKPD